jgi:hypothetical protein
MTGRRTLLGFALLVFFSISPSRGDEFDRLGSEIVGSLLRDPKTRTHQAIGFRELEGLPTVLHDSRAALVLVRTDQANWAKLLVTPGLRKVPVSKTALVPVLMIERFASFDASRAGFRLARGRELILFPGFQFDLDTGQIVPDGLGGDIVFTAKGEDDGTISPLGTARLATLTKAPELAAAAPGSPSPGKAVQPGDFSGRFRLNANGQWSGLLELAVDPVGAVSGTFSSDASGSVYPVTGKVGGDSPQKIRFTIEFPRTRPEYQGILWTEGKSVIAGMLRMLERDFSFVAVREGTRLDLEGTGEAVALSPADRSASWLRVRVEAGSDRYRVDKNPDPKSATELTEFLGRSLKAAPKIKVLIVAGESVPQARVRKAIEAVRASGVTAIRLAPVADEP